MMKIIKYQIMTKVNYGTEDEPQIAEIFASKMIECGENVFEANLALAQAEAVGGEVTVEDIEDPITEPTQAERFEAQLTYTAMMTDTLLPEEE